MDLQHLHIQLNELKRNIDQILSQSGFDVCNDLYDMECGSDPDSLMLREELTDVLDHLDVVSSILAYLNKRVVGEYTLRKKSNGKYGCEIWEYSCGNMIEFYNYDEDLEKRRWYLSRIEYDGHYSHDYYIVGFRKMQLDGLKIRIRK